MSTPAVLVLEDGRCFHGEAYGAIGETFGEAVFATAMTGYQETLTDPSYRGQILVMTAPHIGNTGMNDADRESANIWVSGFVVRDPARVSSNFRSLRSLEDDLIAHGIVSISGIDTRSLTRHLRDHGAMRAGISSLSTDEVELLNKVRSSPSMVGADLVADVTTQQPYLIRATSPARFTVAAIDLGIKSNTPALMAERGMDVHVLPSGTSFDEILAVNPDGVFFSNGPGDPAAAQHAIALLREILDARIPYFGICFGHQIFGRALGLETYKLRFGHRGINQPVKDLRTGKIEITSHNHGFAVAAPIEGTFDTSWGPARVTHLGLNDTVVEGLELLDAPAFSVQYHPESAAGPHDSTHLFDRFRSLMEEQVHA